MTASSKMTLHHLLMAAQDTKSLRRWARLKSAAEHRISAEARPPQVGDRVMVIPFNRSCYRGILVARNEEEITVQPCGDWPAETLPAAMVLLRFGHH